jgi:hypothetical protein
VNLPRPRPDANFGGGTIGRESALHGKQIKFQSESVMADLCLGVAIAGMNTLIGIALIIVFA